ncbi:MAG UNVERIFIED_CONTAM: helix-hairpin-helix domain-containing protein [Planctomycetaceae bacterium]
MTQSQLDQQLDKSIEAFCVIPEVTPELAENLVSQGFFTFDDLSVIEPDQLVEISGLTEEDCNRIVEYADEESRRVEEREKLVADQRRSAAPATSNPSTPQAEQTTVTPIPTTPAENSLPQEPSEPPVAPLPG